MKRQINIELLRIVAMLMVLGLHANFVALHIPDADSILTFTGINRVFWQSACIVAVNVFVMISGWFGIKPSIKGFCNFMWQVVYIVGLLWIVGVIFFNQSVSMKSLLRIIGLYGGGGWFVASYIALYIISHILNAYVEKKAPRNIVLMLVAFFLFEFLWGNTLSVEFVVGGYSTFSFIGIYLLAGLLRKLDLKYSSKTYLGVFFIAAIINTVCIIVAVAAGLVAVRDTILNYINPLVIIGGCIFVACICKKHNSYTRIYAKRRYTTRCIVAVCILFRRIFITCGFWIRFRFILRWCQVAVRCILWVCRVCNDSRIYLCCFFISRTHRSTEEVYMDSLAKSAFC